MQGYTFDIMGVTPRNPRNPCVRTPIFARPALTKHN
jgi:hypothetical protein